MTARREVRDGRTGLVRRWWGGALTLALGLVTFPLAGAPPVGAVVPGDNGLIAFSSTRDGNNEIYVMSADGTNPQNLTTDPATDLRPAWSPNGTRIAFTTDRAGPEFDIYVMSAAGTNTQNLTNHPARDDDAAWSPDGTRIAFASAFRDGSNNFDVFVMNADGTNPQRLTDVSGDDRDPSWSPDGTRIVFSSQRDGGNTEIYVMNADGTNPQRLTDHTALDFAPAWSPDGSQIAFTSTRDDASDVFVMNSDGTSPQNRTDTPEQDGGAVWSPDGTRIAFHSSRDGDFEILSMNAADGTDVRQLTDDPATEIHPDWQSTDLPPAPVVQATTLAANPAAHGWLSVRVRARLTVATTGAAVAGQPVYFHAGATPLCVSYTDASGVAACTGGLNGWLAVVVQRTYQASFGGSDAYLPSTTSAPA